MRWQHTDGVGLPKARQKCQHSTRAVGCRSSLRPWTNRSPPFSIGKTLFLFFTSSCSFFFFFPACKNKGRETKPTLKPRTKPNGKSTGWQKAFIHPTPLGKQTAEELGIGDLPLWAMRMELAPRSTPGMELSTTWGTLSRPNPGSVLQP